MSKEKQKLDLEGAKRVVPELRFPEFENSNGWKKKAFSKLFKIGSGRDYKHLGKGEIPVYGTGGYMLSVDDFLYDGKSACIVFYYFKILIGLVTMKLVEFQACQK